ncbi:hypothetical protein ZOSMA_33G00460 [Zostera marina]|uniref:Uncharacterized protein n=1 Tax=Zostera marina TaxID=29655 RepID=A0A0K9P7J8_ZOSMR|nr:hypothetical protein ZOSMA_33G00460 [Zostera marina]
MGACFSCQVKEISPISSPVVATRVIFPDGSLQEYRVHDHPKTISMVGLNDNMFLCNADDIQFGGCFVGVDSNQFLQLGQIYFALPKTLLNRPISSDDMAKLANRAISALANSDVVVTMELFEEKTSKKNNSFASKLTVIPE